MGRQSVTPLTPVAALRNRSRCSDPARDKLWGHFFSEENAASWEKKLVFAVPGGGVEGKGRVLALSVPV